MEAKTKKALTAALISRPLLLLNMLMISKILESDNYSECLPLISINTG